MRLIYLLGLKELSPPPLNLKRLYKETLEIEPILIIISPGADPSQELQELANAERSGECYHQVSAHHSAVSVPAIDLPAVCVSVCVCVCVFVCALSRSVVSSSLWLQTPWTVACQAPLSMEFSRQEYWNT